MNTQYLEKMTKKDLLISIAEVGSKQFVDEFQEVIAFDLKDLKNKRKADLAEVFYSAVMSITGIRIKNKIVPVLDQDLNGEYVQEHKNIAEAKLSTETLNRFVLLSMGATEKESGEPLPEEPTIEETNVETHEEVQIVDSPIEPAAIEEEIGEVVVEEVEEKKKKGRKKAEPKSVEPQQAEEPKAPKPQREQRERINRLQSVIFAISDLGVYASLEEVAVLSDRIYLQANPTRLSNVREPMAIAKNVTIILLATGFLKYEGGQYTVQGKLTDEFSSLRR